MTHPNAQYAWNEIRCARGHEHHDSLVVDVDLAQPHGYHDLPQLPPKLRPRFVFGVWPPDQYPVDGGPYCPAHDAVSETIVSHGIWEPIETALTLTVCRGARAGVEMVDFGAQLGWYSMLAASCGLEVYAYEADPANAFLLRSTALLNGWGDRVHVREQRVGPESVPIDASCPIRFAKIDVEGSESDAVAMLGPSIAARLVDHILIEVSPVFRGMEHYVDLLRRLMDEGYVAYRLPGKASNPQPIVDPGQRLVRLADPSDIDARQENLWLRHDSAAW